MSHSDLMQKCIVAELFIRALPFQLYKVTKEMKNCCAVVNVSTILRPDFASL